MYCDFSTVPVFYYFQCTSLFYIDSHVFLHECRTSEPTVCCRTVLAKHSVGRSVLLQWLTEHFHLTVEDAKSLDHYAFRKAAEYGHLLIVQWLTEHFNLTDDDVGSHVRYYLWRRLIWHSDVRMWLQKRFGVV